ncbi:hypothetical protein [Engelhardtia mirabilis]|uniref:Guanosine-5'-triphosphate,3'-diphosphate pyrophosphatase n=1 Tax=Engelhardtia mirabilis TaxID=2528011 RepID=A0A518BL88_9BACT|nr:Guanosine-5'-triphosphate,3'-diphosphate pyrophosphatase [Planctomycetes bacterium Pla133]QDV02060.1 Guanosine-5'-triphosphate,3'-diphosphate pyrophosphatase [Planctomycetes bacterium Pla86]
MNDVSELGPPAAAIDLGTETALLVIGRHLPDGSLEVLEDHCLATRLGAGLALGGASGARLDPRAVERTLDVLETFVRRIELAGVAPERVRAAGTAALRAAGDASSFLAAAVARCGLHFEVLTPDREAALSFDAVLADGASRDVVVIDLGGGSAEVIRGGGQERFSVPLGAVVATDRWLGGAERLEPIDPKSWSAFRAAARDLAADLPDGAARGAELVLLGGTASNLACLDRGLESYEPRLAQGWTLAAAAAGAWAERLAALGLEERMDHPIEPGRAGILPGGLGCLAAVLERLGATEGRVSGRGLRYGLLREALAP